MTFLLTICFEQIKEFELGKVCGIHEGAEKYIKVVSGETEGNVIFNSKLPSE
jgi:hypothetical protein